MKPQPATLRDFDFGSDREIVIDYEKDWRISISDNDSLRPAMDMAWALGLGLTHIAHRIAQVEANRRLPIGRNPHVDNATGVRSAAGMMMESSPQIAPWFRWYSVEACNFVDCVASLAVNADLLPTRELKDYKRDALGPLFAFRNKISAHLACFLANKRDTDAERQAALSLTGVGWDGNFFWIHPGILHLHSEDRSESSEELQPWSVTVAHLRLSARYWRAWDDPTTHGICHRIPDWPGRSIPALTLTTSADHPTATFEGRPLSQSTPRGWWLTD